MKGIATRLEKDSHFTKAKSQKHIKSIKNYWSEIAYW